MFKPYTRQQLSEIVTARLEGLDVFEPNAIKFAAAKVRSTHLAFSYLPYGQQ